MKREELLALQRVEEEHWFYKGKRDLVKHWIRLLRPELRSSDLLLDAGAGTGSLVLELRRQPDIGKARIRGVEYSADARSIAKELYSIELDAGSILEIPAEDNACTFAIALDVLEHVELDTIAYRELLRITKPGGYIITNVPAMPSLWSDWDVSLGHFRRYTMASYKSLLRSLGEDNVKIHYLSYINVAAFPLIKLYRGLRKFFPAKEGERAEDKVPGNFLNSLLYASLVIPAKWRWFAPPFGVSIFCVLQKLDKR